IAQNVVGEDRVEVTLNADRLRYNYIFGTCDKTCGGGTQSPSLVCYQIDEFGNDVLVLNSQCEAANLEIPTRPPIRECNAINCPLIVVPQEFGPCSVTCGEGIQTRIYGCEQTKSDGVIEQLSLSVCLAAGLTSPEPPESQVCVITGSKIKNSLIDSCDSAEDFEYRQVLEWSECTKSCHEGRRYRRVACY
ncbi:thrombospondin type-1 domain-containing protein, partial [Salmonella sp. s51228]|uniref:thrombospondin type-1 domain-containing protein n=1 Tax=Salmonella sp. s51228 TaxID=3159652 RepID=UPI003980C946